MAVVLRDYQERAVFAAVDGLADADRGQVIMACGTGKTIVGLTVADLLLDGSGVLCVLVPNLALLQQWYQQLPLAFSDSPHVLGVCSDEELTGSEVQVAAETTTSTELVQQFLAGARSGVAVLLATYHSSDKVGAATVAVGRDLDLVIADEAHRTAGQAEAAFSTVLYQSQFRARKRLFLTATPRVRLTTRDAAGRRMVSMSDTLLYGKRPFTYTFGEAIDEARLSDYKVVITVLTDSDIHRSVMLNSGLDVEGESFNSASLAACTVVQESAAALGLNSLIVFHNRVNSSRAFTTNLKLLQRVSDYQRPNIFHLDGSSSQSERDGAIRALGAEDDALTVVSNVKVLAEGVDIPAVDSVMFAEPKTSQVEVVQAIGRALRLAPDKKTSYIIIPVYLAPGENPDAMLSGSEFRHVWQVINAIRDHDHTLDRELDQIERNDYDPTRPRYEQSILPERIVLTGVSANFEQFRDAVTLKVLDRFTSSWSTGVAEFSRYVARPDATAYVPSRYVSDSQFPLGAWVQAQRQNYLWQRLTDEQIAQLEELGFSWGRRAEQARTHLRLLDAYAGTMRRPVHNPVTLAFYGHSTYLWLLEQVRRFRAGTLRDSEIEALDTRVRNWRSTALLPDGWINTVTRANLKRRSSFLLQQANLSILANCRGQIDDATTDLIERTGITLPDVHTVDLTDPDWEEQCLRHAVTNPAPRISDRLRNQILRGRQLSVNQSTPSSPPISGDIDGFLSTVTVTTKDAFGLNPPRLIPNSVMHDQFTPEPSRVPITIHYAMTEWVCQAQDDMQLWVAADTGSVWRENSDGTADELAHVQYYLDAILLHVLIEDTSDTGIFGAGADSVVLVDDTVLTSTEHLPALSHAVVRNTRAIVADIMARDVATIVAHIPGYTPKRRPRIQITTCENDYGLELDRLRRRRLQVATGFPHESQQLLDEAIHGAFQSVTNAIITRFNSLSDRSGPADNQLHPN